MSRMGRRSARRTPGSRRALVGWAVALAALWVGRPAALPADVLAGFRWQSAAELQELAAAGGRVRYVTAGRVLIELSAPALAGLRAAGHLPFVADEDDGSGAYYLATAAHGPGPGAARCVYADPAGWTLLHLRRDAAAGPCFLYPLPEEHSIRGWLPGERRARPAAARPADEVAAVLAAVDQDRLRRDVLNLSQHDAAAPSAPGNLRTRFVVHPDARLAAEYIRAELAAVLGDSAVHLEEFSVELERLSGHLKGRLGDGEIDPRAYNVVGELPGAAPGAGHHIICAHYDDTGVRSPGWNWRTDPAPGADDNATGVAIMLEAARVLAPLQLPWSIRFVAFSGEELGLLGSRAYAAAVEADSDQVLGVINVDMVGYNSLAERVELATNAASRWLADLLVAANQTHALGLRVDVREDEGARLSDHASFWARGCDAILAIENYLPTDSTHYAVRQGLYRLNAQYHTTADVADSLNWPLVHKIARLTVAALAQYAVPGGLPNLAVFAGDLVAGGAAGDSLRLRVANLGRSAVVDPFAVSVAHCGADSTHCREVFRAEYGAPVAPGGAAVLSVPWAELGPTVFRVEVDVEDRVAEVSEADNSAFQRLYLQSRDRIVAYPNPFRPGENRRLVFTGLPLEARVCIFAPDGGLVWSAREDDPRQRRLGPAVGEVWWLGVNGSAADDREAPLVGSGVYGYAISSSDGRILARDRIAVIR